MCTSGQLTQQRGHTGSERNTVVTCSHACSCADDGLALHRAQGERVFFPQILLNKGRREALDAVLASILTDGRLSRYCCSAASVLNGG